MSKAGYDEALRKIEAAREAGSPSLDLSGIDLEELPAEIGGLTALETLYLHYNQLSELPAEIGGLTALTTLFLHNNPDLRIPTEILGPYLSQVVSGKSAKPPGEILEYYFRIKEPADLQPLNEFKAILVGPAETHILDQAFGLRPI